MLEPSSARAGRGTAHGASPGGEGARCFFPCSRQGRLLLPLPPPPPAADEGGATSSDGPRRPSLAPGHAAAPAASLRPGPSLPGHSLPGHSLPGHSLPGLGHSAAQPCVASASGDADADADAGAEAEAEAEAEAGTGAGGVPAGAEAQWLLDEFGAHFGLD